jgi:tetratricopeptide (TPR) repeat protein
LKSGGAAGQALPFLEDAQRRFEAVEQRTPGRGAARMAAASLTEQGDCLQDLGRLDEAAETYEENNRRAEELEDARQAAVGKLQLGTVRMYQRRYPEALAAYEEARKIFENLGEPVTVSIAWHRIGIVASASRPAQGGRARLSRVAGHQGAAGDMSRVRQTPWASWGTCTDTFWAA